MDPTSEKCPAPTLANSQDNLVEAQVFFRAVSHQPNTGPEELSHKVQHVTQFRSSGEANVSERQVRPIMR